MPPKVLKVNVNGLEVCYWALPDGNYYAPTADQTFEDGSDCFNAELRAVAPQYCPPDEPRAVIPTCRLCGGQMAHVQSGLVCVECDSRIIPLPLVASFYLEPVELELVPQIHRGNPRLHADRFERFLSSGAPAHGQASFLQ